jgi:hypothetical protein
MHPPGLNHEHHMVHVHNSATWVGINEGIKPARLRPSMDNPDSSELFQSHHTELFTWESQQIRPQAGTCRTAASVLVVKFGAALHDKVRLEEALHS